MIATRENKSVAEFILAKQKTIEDEIKKINNRHILEQNERSRQDMSDTFVSMSTDLFKRATNAGALTRPVSEMCSGLTMMGIGYGTSNPALIVMGAYQTAMGLLSFGEDDETFVSSH